jgi:hypothetical protein
MMKINKKMGWKLLYAKKEKAQEIQPDSRIYEENERGGVEENPSRRSRVSENREK